MVYAKERGKKINFDKDPLHLERYTEQDTVLQQRYGETSFIKANGTSLGMDNGSGIVQIMGIATDDSVCRPRLELLFAVDEEEDVTGAKELDPATLGLTAPYLINTDSSDYDEICIGCAGYTSISSSTDCNRNTLTTTVNGSYVRLALGGFQGGHSGGNIHENRGNAILFMAQLVRLLPSGARITTMNGGEAENAIPRDASAIVYIPHSAAQRDPDWRQHLQNLVAIERSHCNRPQISLTIRKIPETHSHIRAMTAGCHNRIIPSLSRVISARCNRRPVRCRQRL